MKFKLLNAQGVQVESDTKGTFGGNGRDKIYGRLDCPSALNALKVPDSPYKKHRVFFADEATARVAGFRPCGNCLRKQYAAWKQERGE